MQALMLNVVCALGIGVLGYPLAEFGLWLMGVGPEVIPLGVPYLRVMLLGGVMMFLSRTLTAIFRGAGDAMTPMVVLIFSSVVNIVLDPLLIFGIWGFPRLGVVGSAYATVIGRSLGVVILLYLCSSCIKFFISELFGGDIVFRVETEPVSLKIPTVSCRKRWL